MRSYNINLHNGHVLITADDGSIILIDTGSPLSFHRDGRFELDGQSFSSPTSLMNVNADYATQNVGTQIDGLIGMNVISRLGMMVDVPNGIVTFGAETDGWRRIPSSTFGAVVINLTVAGKSARMALDTGAPISYIGREYTDGRESIGTATDFHPLKANRFEVPLYEMDVNFDGKQHTMQMGTAPTDVAAMMSLLGLNGAIGMELLRSTPILIADGSVWVK